MSTGSDILEPLYPYLAQVQSLASPYLSQLETVAAPLIQDAQLRVADLRELATPYLGPLFEYAERVEDALPTFSYPIAYIAAAAIVLHVANYNLTAQLEYHTRIFTKIFRSPAVYLYALYLIASALVRDHYVMQAVEGDVNSYILFSKDAAKLIGHTLITFGVLLNLWTLKALGIKGMYNGDSFGHLMDAPVSGGPYSFFHDPQYVGTTLALLGYAVKCQSWTGYVLTAVLYATFWISVKFVEGPHMNRIYANKGKKATAAQGSKKTPRKKFD
ncbi:hypothetical protein SpCBS45565_g00532 [Spizellomyces sp. 'palustris']|nr:hypothetical protein SpCBS45565_g00532 [Spizellomyces sp. 'palustris']